MIVNGKSLRPFIDFRHGGDVDAHVVNSDLPHILTYRSLVLVPEISLAMDSDVSSLLQQVDSLGKLHTLNGSSGSDPQTRRDLRAAVAKLNIALENSGDIIDRITYMVTSILFFLLFS